jgi:outer membrane protein OmpA-like peptidoglycan-associated protein
MQNNQSSYSLWSWVIAAILALVLLLMYLAGKGPITNCCQTKTEPALNTSTEPTEESLVSTDLFSFSASEDDFTGNGDATSISWINDIDALKALLAGGITAEGGQDAITLFGTVESEEDKLQKELNAQSFFGPDVIINSNILVTIPEPISTPPETAIIYFDSGVHRLPIEGVSILEPTIAWLSQHSEAKATVSGYHDPTGDLESNQKLAKKRAQSIYDILLAAGIAADRIEMRKPESTDGGGDLDEARRVEVNIE